MKKQEKMPPGFFLNIQSVYDALEEYYESIRLFKENNNSCLIGVQYYYGQKELDKSYLYLCDGEELERHPFTMKEGYLIVVGECNRSHIVFGCSWIHMKEAQYSAFAMRELFNRIQEIFSKNHICEKKINYILNHDGTIEDVCALARDYFHNPVFIHDTYYNILAVSEMPENAMHFAYNNRTGKYTQDAETLNNFRVSKEYKKTLLTHGGHIWDSDFDEGRCIYVNIWQDGVYRGRFILLELLSSLKTGQLKAAEYFAEAIRILLERRDIKDNEEQHPLKGIVQDALNGKLPDEANLEMQLSLFSWNRTDAYLCSEISFVNEEITQMSIYRMCGNIEEQIPGSYACYYNHKIYLLVNMDVNHFSLQDFRKRMVYIIREGLFHIGVSMVFYDILEMQYYFRQAEVALYYGTQQNQMVWYHTFDAYVLDYWMKEGIGTLTKDTIINPAIYILEQYDREHGTDLYETLKTYLTYERNGTLTARIMKIHRSTLPHRLERIQRLTGLNLESPEVRLYLLMSFYFHSSV